MFTTYAKDIKSTWRLINTTLGRTIKRGANIPDFFKENDKYFNSNESISNGFCNFFTDIGPNLKSKIPMTETSYEKFMPPRTQTTFNFNKITSNELIKVISSIKPKNSYGFDLISNRVLKK